jgi:hypothetical protein
MMLVFLLLINTVLVTRIFWIFSDDQVPLGTLIKGLLLQLLALIALERGSVVWLLGLGIIVGNLLTWLLESQAENEAARFGGRLVTLGCWVLLFGGLCGDPIGVSLHQGLIQCIQIRLCLNAADPIQTALGRCVLLGFQVRAFA